MVNSIDLKSISKYIGLCSAKLKNAGVTTNEMKTVTNIKDLPDKEMLKTWYEESIALVQPAVGEPHESDVFSTTFWHPGLGILTTSHKGEEIHAAGNTQVCRAYLEKKNKCSFLENAIHVEQFEDGIIIANYCRETLRTIYADRATLLNMLNNTTPGIKLPNSEYALLLQILCGMSLKEASDADKVSYETKRSQFKSLAARSGYKSQSEVIRHILLSLTAFSLDSVDVQREPIAPKSNSAEAFLSIYYPGIFRYHQISDGDGRLLRVAETGPIDGEAVIWLHSQTLPRSSQFMTRWTHKNGIRLIIPFRSGFLENTEYRYSKREHVESCAQDIARTIEYFARGNARIVASSTGAAYGVYLAENYPDHVKKLVICAAAYVGKYENKPIRRIVNGFKNLAMKNELLIKKSFDRYISKMSTQAGALEVLRVSYEKSSYDMDIFENLLSSRMGHSWLYESYRTSRYSVIMDVILGDYDVWKNARDIKCPVLFVHGRSDPINSIESARKVAGLFTKPEFVELQEDGQSLFLQRFSDLMNFESEQDYKDADLISTID